jgi:hypothetical protein
LAEAGGIPHPHHFSVAVCGIALWARGDLVGTAQRLTQKSAMKNNPERATPQARPRVYRLLESHFRQARKAAMSLPRINSKMPFNQHVLIQPARRANANQSHNHG